MRTIKFRVWDIKEQKMFFSHIHRCFYLDIFAGNMLFGDPNNFIIQQFTGLIDKKGNEIYEGDIVRFIDDESTINLFCRYDQSNAWFTFGEIDDAIYEGYYWQEILRNCEVIGNICENPELLLDKLPKFDRV